MPVTVMLEVKAKKGTGNDLVKTFASLLPDTRAYDGCISLDFYQNQDDPDTLIAHEQWESKEHYQKYLGWREETGVLGQLLAAIDGDPSIRYFDLTDA